MKTIRPESDICGRQLGATNWLHDAELLQHLKLIAYHPFLGDLAILELQDGHRVPLYCLAAGVHNPNPRAKTAAGRVSHVVRKMNRDKVTLTEKMVNLRLHRHACRTRRRGSGFYPYVARRGGARGAPHKPLP